MLYAIIGIFPLFQPILGYVNHKHSSAFVALGPLALWSQPFNKDENPPLNIVLLEFEIDLKNILINVSKCHKHKIIRGIVGMVTKELISLYDTEHALSCSIFCIARGPTIRKNTPRSNIFQSI